MATTTSSNYTSLYGGSGGTVVPTTPYGNANVVSLLAVGTDGANTVGNITSTGQITATGNIQTSAFFIGDGSLLTNLAGGGYGNANVAAFLPTYTGAMTAMTGNVTTTANISGNYFVGNGSLLTGITGTGTYGNANVVSLMSAFGSNTIVTTGNITGGNFIGSGAALTSVTGANVTGTVANATFATSAGTATSAITAGTVTTAAQPNITSTGTLTSVATSGTISATGNITGNYYIGNGSLLTGITGSGTYGNANVAANLAAFANNPISTTGNITSGNLLISNVGGGAPRIIGYNGAKLTFSGPTGLVYLLGGDDSVSSSTLELGVLNAVGNITGGNINTGGRISATGNISGNYFTGNGSLLTGITATLGNNISVSGNILAGGFIGAAGNLVADKLITNSLADIGGNLDVAGNITAPLSTVSAGNIIAIGSGLGFISATANITGGNLITSGRVSAGTTINATGNITGSFFIGNGSQLTGITTTYGNSNVAAFLPTYTGEISGGNISILGQTTTGVLAANTLISSNGNISSQTNVLATGNVIAGNLVTSGSVVATTNLIGASVLTSGTSGNISGVNYITANYFVGNGSFLTSVPTTPTPAGGSPTQVQYSRSDSTFGGIAYMTFNDSNGNIAIQNTLLNTANVITTVQPFNDALQSATVTNPGRIQIGTGYNGNTSTSVDPSNWNRGALVDIYQNITKGDNGRRTAALNVEMPVELTANIANASTRLSAGRQALTIGGGANAYSMTSTNVNAWPTGIQTGVRVGPDGNVLVGNTALSGAIAMSGSLDTGGTSTIATGTGIRQQFNGNISNITGMFTQMSLSAVGNTVSVIRNDSSYHNTNARSSTEYNFLNNTDPVAQNRLGSLRSYTEFNYTGLGTSGGITVSKNQGQVQQVTPTGAITSITYSDFVPSASDGTNTDQQADTVTLIIAQGATGYAVTMPSGSQYKYSGGTTTVGTTANSVTMIAITAVNISGTTTYLTTISPEFV